VEAVAIQQAPEAVLLAEKEEVALVCDFQALLVTLQLDYLIREVVVAAAVASRMLFKKMVLLVALEWFWYATA
jgi:hypothetical protein